MEARTLIGAVLAPHHTEDTQLRVTRFTAEKAYDFLKLRGSKLMLLDQLRRDGHLVRAGTAESIDSNTPSPSVEPISGSQARSGCGIIPITLRSRFNTPAISRIDPFGLSR